MRGWSDKRITEFLQGFYKENEQRYLEEKKKKEQPKKRKPSRSKADIGGSSSDRLFIFWTDPSGGHGAEEYYRQASHLSNMSDELLVQTINHYMGQSFGMVGQYDFKVGSSASAAELQEYFYSEGWTKVYEGRCRYFRPLLLVLATMMVSMYDPNLKLQFTIDFIEKVSQFNQEFADRLSMLFL